MRKGFLNREYQKDKPISQHLVLPTDERGKTETSEPAPASSNDIGITKRGFLNKERRKQSDDAHISSSVAIKPTASPAPKQNAKLVPVPSKYFHSLGRSGPSLKGWTPNSAGLTAVRIAAFPRLPIIGSPGVCLFPGNIKEAIEAMPNFPRMDVSYVRLDADPCQIRKSSIPNGGLGMFATDDLEAGDLIIKEYPFIAQPQALPLLKGAYDPESIMRTLFEQLPPEGQTIFWSLHNCKPASTHSPLKGIFDTNALPIDLRPEDPQYAGIAKNISRINHSCSPNAGVTWSLEEWSWRVWALRPIKKDEEITITYVPYQRKRSTRREILRTDYSILSCTCSCCSLPPAQSKQSDQNRLRLANYVPPQWYIEGLPDSELEAAARDSDPEHKKLKEIIKESTTWMALMEKEECWLAHVIGFHSQRLVKAWLALGQKGKSMAVKVAKRAQVLERIHAGSDGAWPALLQDVEASDWWDRANQA